MTDSDRGGRWFENVPWWMVSMGLHAVVLLAAALVYIDQLFAEVTVIDTRLSQEAPRKFVEPPARRDDLVRRAVDSDGDPVSAMDNVVVFDGLSEPGDTDVSCPGHFVVPVLGTGSDRGPRGDPTATAPLGRDRMKLGYIHRGVACGTRLKDPSSGGCGGTTLLALQWLARHQGADGSWSAGSAAACCGGGGEAAYDTGVTALSLLAFLGAGYTHVSRDELDGRRMGDVVKRSLQWLISQQDPEGCVGPRGPKYLYNHAIAALALSEAYGMTSSAVLEEPAQKAIDFLVSAQNPGRGWRYDVRPGENDTSVTGWAVMALKSAELSELRFPRCAYDGALAWLDQATERGRVGYRRAGNGKVVETGVNEQFADHPAMTAVGVMSRLFITKKLSDPVQQGAQLLLSDLPAWEPNRVDFYYWYYASLALFQKDGPDGPMWRAWNEPLKRALVPHQATSKDGCRRGSWDPSVDRWGHAGGRVYATALNCLTLEVYYRYASVFGGVKK